MNKLPTPEDADAVHSREGLAAYVLKLHVAVADGVEIENPTTERFLEAMSAWIKDSDGFFRNTGRAVPGDDVEWSFFAHTLSAALIYE